MIERRVENRVSEGTCVDTGSVKLAWGSSAQWKARWRDEALVAHLARPVGERLQNALSLVIRRSDREPRSI